MAKPILSIIIPTWNLPQYLNPCIRSIVQTNILNSGAEIIIVNNGEQPIEELVKGVDGIKVLNPGENLGWERGLEYALKHTDAEFVVFQNDDTFIPPACHTIYQKMLSIFADPTVGAVGPETTTAAGWHSIFHDTTPTNLAQVTYLIFFTVMLRRKALDEVGGVDTNLPGGDDLDLSIRLRDAGYKLFVNPQAFLIHHAFKTGTRVKGESNVDGGWNSRSMSDETNKAIIRKHGFRKFMDTMTGNPNVLIPQAPEDAEGLIIKSRVKGKKVVELGCGATKTIPNSIGVDRIPKDEVIPYLLGAKSVADVVADVQKELPKELEGADTVIARHILEHCLDLDETITAWAKVLKKGGRLIIACPDETISKSIPMNPEHVHAFTPKTLGKLLIKYGLKQVEAANTGNGISFVGVYEKQ